MNKILYMFLISMIPVVELRGSIPYAAAVGIPWHIALPLAIAAFALVVTVFAVLAWFFLGGIALVIAGAAFLPAAVFMTGALGQGLIVAGYGLLLISVGILMIIGTTALWRVCVRGVAALLRRKGAEHA